MISYILTPETLELVVNERVLSLARADIDLNKVMQLIEENDEAGLVNEVDPSTNIKMKTMKLGNVIVEEGVVTVNGVEIHGTMVTRLLDLIEKGYDTRPVVRFMERIINNTSYHVCNELYDFLEIGKMPLTQDGKFLAYKVVRGDYKDKHSGKFDNSVGQELSMPRHAVDDERTRTCSYGFHFCSFDYIRFFYSSGDRIVVVEVDPVDVVSIPADYNNTKARCCRYQVIADVTEAMVDKIEGEAKDAFLGDSWDGYESDMSDYEEYSADDDGFDFYE